MVQAYSLDLRERVVADVRAGRTCRVVAERFSVSVASVVRWSQRERATGSAAAMPMGGHRPFALADQKDWLLARIAKSPDVTLRALVAELKGRNIDVSLYAVWHLLEREGITFKKKPARQRTGPAGRGAQT
jgi:transposase